MIRRAVVTYSLVGATLALGAPFGWLLWRMVSGPSLDVVAEVQTNTALYAYLFIGTTSAFALFGAMLGRRHADLLDANAVLQTTAVTDSLTGMKNARYFRARLAEEVARAHRTGMPLALLMADLDRFKRVNDTYGHAVGDLVLASLGDVVTSCVRTSDSACRVGGEEIGVVCPQTSEEEARAVAERIRIAMEARRVDTERGPVSITISLGVACLDADESADALFRRADAALYAAKEAGRNRVMVAPPTPTQV